MFHFHTLYSIQIGSTRKQYIDRKTFVISNPFSLGIYSRRSRHSPVYSPFKCFVVIYVFLCAKRQARMDEDFSECI